MANSLYDAGRDHFLNADIDWTADTIKVALVDGADYTPSLSTDDAWDDVPVAGRVAVSAAMTCTSAAGVADASNVTLTSVTGDECEYLVLFKDSGLEATSWLIGLIDTATNLPVTPNGGDININWDDGANKIFKL